MDIDQGKMFRAISTRAAVVGLPEEKGFLNRGSGEIAFLHDGDEGEAMEGVFGRAAIDAAPADWVEIPKYSQHRANCGEEEFVRRFLQAYGIQARLV